MEICQALLAGLVIMSKPDLSYCTVFFSMANCWKANQNKRLKSLISLVLSYYRTDLCFYQTIYIILNHIIQLISPCMSLSALIIQIESNCRVMPYGVIFNKMCKNFLKLMGQYTVCRRKAVVQLYIILTEILMMSCWSKTMLARGAVKLVCEGFLVT